MAALSELHGGLEGTFWLSFCGLFFTEFFSSPLFAPLGLASSWRFKLFAGRNGLSIEFLFAGCGCLKGLNPALRVVCRAVGGVVLGGAGNLRSMFFILSMCSDKVVGMMPLASCTRKS